MKKSNLTKFLWGSISLTALFGVYIFIEPFLVQVKEVDIVDEDIPDSFDGARIVFMSDIHHGPYLSRNRVKGFVKKANALKPDIIILGGDYVQGRRYIKPCFEELKNLKAPLGKFGVLGNHDHWGDADLTRRCMKDAGITLLDNRSEWIDNGAAGGRIKIGGIGDLWHEKPDIEATIHDVTEKDFVILVTHNPDYAEEIKTHKIRLVLSGHTHGGQVTLFGLLAAHLPTKYGQKYRGGIVTTEYTKVIVSKGTGTIYPPVRFFCRPEIYLIRLKKY
ncbi:MAG: metallophosphoesterase [Firmicutes bacterium]|nr:metallophosphoesterase [Bacillota bacterium]